MESDAGLTADGSFTATIAYASPEQLSSAAVDHRSDQYSLACTLFMLLAGRTPFDYTNAGQVITAHLVKPPPRVTEVRPDVPAALDGVIARGMAKQPNERFASCGEFVAAARAALSVEAVPAPHRLAPTVLAQPDSAPSHPVAPMWVPPGAPPMQPVPAMQSAPVMQQPPGWPSSRPARRGPRRGLIAVGAVLGVIVVCGVGGAMFLPGLIAEWKTKEWGIRNQAIADTFPKLVSARDLGTGWHGLDCYARSPGPAPGVKLEGGGAFENGIQCDDDGINYQITVLDFGSPDRAKAYIDALDRLPYTQIWHERHSDFPSPLPIVSAAHIGAGIYTGFPDDPVRGRFVVGFYKKGKTVSDDTVPDEQVIDEMWRNAPLGR
jgi:serine/threonine-protein kinase